MWTYRARIIDVIDSCTVDMQVDLGFHAQTEARVAIEDAHWTDGPEAAAQIEAWARARSDDSPWPFILTTKRTAWRGLDEDHERYIGTITTPNGDSLNQHLIKWADDMPF